MRQPATALWGSGLAAAALLLGACASTPDVDPRLVQQTETAIDEAREVDANRYAPRALARAEERLDRARDAMDEGEDAEARRLLQQAAVLAERAEAESLAEQSDQALTQIQENLAALRNQLDARGRGGN